MPEDGIHSAQVQCQATTIEGMDALTAHAAAIRCHLGWTAFVLVVMAALFSTPASADSLRCGNHLVTPGDHLLRVEKVCGAPDYTETVVTHRLAHVYDPWLRIQLPAELLVTIEHWTYNLGPRRFMRRVRFENGTVTRIQDLDYGY